MSEPPPLDIPAIEARALAASETDLAKKRWRVDGYTVWSGDWTKDGQQHPVVLAFLDDDPGAPFPVGTNALLAHIAGCDPTTVLALTGRIGEAAECGRQLGIAEERASVASDKLKQLHAAARGGAFVTGTYDAEHRLTELEARVHELRTTLRNLATNTESKEK